MRKNFISKLFLYKYRFIIGYAILGLAFVVLLMVLPVIAQSGLSAGEIESATSSYYLNANTLLDGNVVDLPYRILQKFSILLFGLTPYAIKLPSVVIGLCLGMLLILLLNRWFKNNVSLLASCLVVLSTPFLFLAGSGTPLIMLVFWPTLLLWLGSKIQGEKRPKPSYCFAFAVCLLLSIFTPYMLYFACFCVLFVILQPHLRFVIKSLPKLPLFMTLFFVAVGGILLILNIINRPGMMMELLLSKDFQPENFFDNIGIGITPLSSFGGNEESVFLAPLISLPILALALIGLFSTTKGFFASRNSIASLLLIFTIIITGFRPEAIIFFVLPFAILVAHGLKYLLEKWYGLFPENPYARVAAIFPLLILFMVILVPSLIQYISGYRYSPKVASSFNYDLEVIQHNLTNEMLVVPQEYYNFYKILEDSTDMQVVSDTDDFMSVQPSNIAFLHSTFAEKSYALSKIITSPMHTNSDIIYLYTVKGE